MTNTHYLESRIAERINAYKKNIAHLKNMRYFPESISEIKSGYNYVIWRGMVKREKEMVEAQDQSQE